ncbi:MAG: hypothetical protein Q9170_007481, partial [Blastenia crenularia]
SGNRCEPLVRDLDLEKRERIAEGKALVARGRMRGREAERMPIASSTLSQMAELTMVSVTRGVKLAQKGYADDTPNDRTIRPAELAKPGKPERKRSNIQATEHEDEGYRNLASRLHLQTPQPRNRQHKNRNVSQDIRRRSDVISNMLCINAFAIRNRLIPKALHGLASEELANDERDEPSNDDDTDADAPEGEFADGEDAMVEEEDGEFQGDDTDGEDASGSEEHLSDVRMVDCI